MTPLLCILKWTAKFWVSWKAKLMRVTIRSYFWNEIWMPSLWPKYTHITMETHTYVFDPWNPTLHKCCKIDSRVLRNCLSVVGIYNSWFVEKAQLKMLKYRKHWQTIVNYASIEHEQSCIHLYVSACSILIQKAASFFGKYLRWVISGTRTPHKRRGLFRHTFGKRVSFIQS